MGMIPVPTSQHGCCELVHTRSFTDSPTYALSLSQVWPGIGPRNPIPAPEQLPVSGEDRGNSLQRVGVMCADGRSQVWGHRVELTVRESDGQILCPDGPALSQVLPSPPGEGSICPPQLVPLPLPHLPLPAPDRLLGLHRPPGLHLLLRPRALALREAPAAAAVLPAARYRGPWAAIGASAPLGQPGGSVGLCEGFSEAASASSPVPWL